MKICSKCKEIKEETEFYFVTRSQSYAAACKSCDAKRNKAYTKTEKGKAVARKASREYAKRNRVKAKDYELKRSYGITLEQFNAMREVQDCKCAICGKHETEAVRGILYVDHCHTTGKVRGLLCSVCNKALGLLKDNEDYLYKAISYLRGDLWQMQK